MVQMESAVMRKVLRLIQATVRIHMVHRRRRIRLRFEWQRGRSLITAQIRVLTAQRVRVIERAGRLMDSVDRSRRRRLL